MVKVVQLAGVLALALVSSQSAASSGFYMLFARGSTAVDLAGQAVVADVAASMRGFPSAYARVSGHADRFEKDKFALSLRRAAAVREALIEGGVAPTRVVVQGLGDSEPAVPPEFGAEFPNRRVEIVIVE